eukprot:4232-Heterococcus_DN1.PRE.1
MNAVASWTDAATGGGGGLRNLGFMQRGIFLLRGTSGEECRAGRVSGAPPPLTTKAAAEAAKQPARHTLWHSCCNRGTLCSSMTLGLTTMCWELGEQGCEPMSTWG